MTDILDLPGWVLTGKRNDRAVETFEAEYVHEARACEKCGSVSFYRHGTKKTTYTDSPLRGGAPISIVRQYIEQQQTPH